MPIAAPRPCSHPGCGVLVRDGKPLPQASKESMGPAAKETKLVETAMESGDIALVTIVATGFIERLVASASELGVLPQFLAALGPSSRRHADAGLEFEG